MIGQSFNRLVVVGPSVKRGRKIYWPCRCECGNETIVRADHLRTGHTQSCGCKNQNKAKRGHAGFREKVHPLRQLWGGMKARCMEPSHISYRLYGAKGVTVCERWMTFENFVEDMSPRPPGTTLDRIRSDGNYCPENCKWSTAIEQGRNKSNNRLVTIYGITQPVTFWAEISQVPVKTIYARLDYGWSPRIAVFAPIGYSRAGLPRTKQAKVTA